MKIYKQSTSRWYLERVIFLIGGVFTLLSLVLGLTLSTKFFYMTGLVGTMQIIFAITGYCPMAIFLNSLGINSK